MKQIPVYPCRTLTEKELVAEGYRDPNYWVKALPTTFDVEMFYHRQKQRRLMALRKKIENGH